MAGSCMITVTNFDIEDIQAGKKRGSFTFCMFNGTLPRGVDAILGIPIMFGPIFGGGIIVKSNEIASSDRPLALLLGLLCFLPLLTAITLDLLRLIFGRTFSVYHYGSLIATRGREKYVRVKFENAGETFTVKWWGGNTMDIHVLPDTYYVIARTEFGWRCIASDSRIKF